MRSTYAHCIWSRSQSPFLLRLGQGPILVQINLQHSQAHSMAYALVLFTHFYVEHHTEKQLVPFLKSFVWLGLGWIRTLYHYTITIESVNI